MGRLHTDSLQGPSELISPLITEAHFQLRPYHATSPSLRLESKFFPLLITLATPLRISQTGFLGS